jgi:hypothetical protein
MRHHQGLHQYTPCNSCLLLNAQMEAALFSIFVLLMGNVVLVVVEVGGDFDTNKDRFVSHSNQHRMTSIIKLMLDTTNLPSVHVIMVTSQPLVATRLCPATPRLIGPLVVLTLAWAMFPRQPNPIHSSQATVAEILPQ